MGYLIYVRLAGEKRFKVFNVTEGYQTSKLFYASIFNTREEAEYGKSYVERRMLENGHSVEVEIRSYR